MASLTARVAVLLFGSGFCALVYQLGWFREFRLIFGASTAASAAVLAIFIGGLGAGGLLLGPRADRDDHPLRLYATLETIVAVSAALTPLLLTVVRVLYIALGGSSRFGIIIATIGRLVLSALVLLVPTLAMGGTLPAAARAVARAGDIRRQAVAALYAFNTLGAVAGCLAATFWILEIFGTRTTLWLAAAINLLVAMFARQVAQRAGEGAVAGAPAPAASPVLRARPAPPAFVLTGSAIVGFAFFLMELIWYRLLAPLLGGSVFTFGLVLALALLGIGVGGLLYALVADDRPPSLAGFAWSCLLEAATIAGSYALGDRLAVFTLLLLPLRTAGFAAYVAGWTIVTTIVVLPPALVAGYQFPLLIALFGRGRERVGRHVGWAYAANTAGAIVGSLAGGFGLLPWLSAPTAWRLVAVVLLALGVAATLLASPRESSGTAARVRGFAVRAPLVAAMGVIVVLLMAPGPTALWRHSGIGAGRVPAAVLTSRNELRAWSASVRRGVFWDGDGTESAVALALEPSGYAFIVNGKADGSARTDAGTQVMLGLIGALSNPHARRALVIGLGTGSTAGWLAAVPTIDRVDVVELEPLVVDIARACRAVNHDAMNNPKVRLTIGDARETLLTGRDRYDLIASEPSNPYRAGIASLFTEEYYRAARARLSEDGVFAQWVQAYEIDLRTLQTIYSTLAAVFPSVETWQTNHGDLVLLASMKPAPQSARTLAARIREEPFASALAVTWRVTDINGLLGHYLATDAVARAFARAPQVDVNTDDRNSVEFGVARSVGRSATPLTLEIRAMARAAGASRPPLSDRDGISWPAVDTAWTIFSGWTAPLDEGPESVPPAEQLRRLALQRYYGDHNVDAARELWRRLADPPRNLPELAMAADLEADAGSEGALPLIERLRAYQPGEADTILAALRVRQGRFAEAVPALEAALTRFRTDPWPLLQYKQKALTLARALGARDQAFARRLMDALRPPFAVRAVDSERLIAQAELAARVDFRGLCREPVGALEPYAPWAEPFLRLRHACYQQTGDPRIAGATRDLEDFVASK